MATLAGSFDSLRVEDRKKSPPPPPLQVEKSPKTILYLTNKEMNKEPLLQIKRIIDGTNSTDIKKSLTKRLFADKDAFLQLLEDENKNIKATAPLNIPHMMMPQIIGDLKEEIEKRIVANTLTEELISLAPAIGYTFWTKCCEAYAKQCIDVGQVMHGVTFLLAVQKYETAIDYLCAKNIYREAWIIGKIYLIDSCDKLKLVLTSWLNYLDSVGNYGAAALL